MSTPSRQAALSVLALGLGWGVSSADAQTYRPGYGDPYDGRGYNAPYPAAPVYRDRYYSRGYNTAPYTLNHDYGDPYSGRGYGAPYDPRGFEQPYIPPARPPYGGTYLPPDPDPREY